MAYVDAGQWAVNVPTASVGMAPRGRKTAYAIPEESGLQVVAVPGIVVNMDLTPADRRPLRDTAGLTPRERLERFAALQKRAMQLLAASPEGYRHYWERNLRQRSIHAKYRRSPDRLSASRPRRLKRAAGRHKDLDDLEHLPAD